MNATESISESVSVFWFRRDLRLEDNAGLWRALKSGIQVLPLFIFDSNILDDFPNRCDARVQFIHQSLQKLHEKLQQYGSGLRIEQGTPSAVWRKLIRDLPIASVYTNRDYEPYARQRDREVASLLQKEKIPFYTFKDQVIFDPEEIRKKNGTPYTVFTPYKNRWFRNFRQMLIKPFPSENLLNKLLRWKAPPLPSLRKIGFKPTVADFPAAVFPKDVIRQYHLERDYPARLGTTRLGVHFRFGTVSIRRAVEIGLALNETWLSELIWREFFMMVLWYFPFSVEQPFREKYAHIPWRTDENDFQRWCHGQTGFPLVDAGIRQLNTTGFMHNRVRMVTANFLTKLLLIDWRWGERYFAGKLLDYEQASNVGNWQWSAGCGADAAPYFRIFNPDTQIQKFDFNLEYIKKWVPEYGTDVYPQPMIDYKSAREFSLNWFHFHLQE